MNFPQAVMLSGYYQVNERWALMANIGRNVTVGATYEFIDLGKAGINQQGGPLQGAYGTNEAYIFAVNLIWKF
jgi:long-subunit fatty acid transport protein